MAQRRPSIREACWIAWLGRSPSSRFYDLIRRSLIASDLAANRETFVWRGRPINQCLIEPVKVICLNSHAANQLESYWLVFEEGPNPGEGYKVIYDEELGEFGLAVTGEVEPIVNGIYGGFVETLNSM